MDRGQQHPVQVYAPQPANQDVYNQLTTAFLHGHTYFAEPPAALLHLRDPYDPAPTRPCATLSTTWRCTTALLLAVGPDAGHDVIRAISPHRSADVSELCRGAVRLSRGSSARSCSCRRWSGVSCPDAALVAAVRRCRSGAHQHGPVPAAAPVQYEVAISCGYCFDMAGLLLMVTGFSVPSPPPTPGAGSLCLGPGGGRTSGSDRRRCDPSGDRHLARPLPPRVPCGSSPTRSDHLSSADSCSVLYNYQVRFGGFRELRGPLSAWRESTRLNAPFDKLKWVIPGLLSYLYVPVRLSLTFPMPSCRRLPLIRSRCPASTSAQRQTKAWRGAGRRGLSRACRSPCSCSPCLASGGGAAAGRPAPPDRSNHRRRSVWPSSPFCRIPCSLPPSATRSISHLACCSRRSLCCGRYGWTCFNPC